MQAKQIGIAILENDGRFLVGVRGPDGPLAGFAEFPGGKCLSGESASKCATRECEEETGLAVEARELLDERVFQYDHATLHLHFWLCQLTSENDGELPEASHGFRWVTVAELRSLNFPEANAGVVDALLARFG